MRAFYVWQVKPSLVHHIFNSKLKKINVRNKSYAEDLNSSCFWLEKSFSDFIAYRHTVMKLCLFGCRPISNNMILLHRITRSCLPSIRAVTNSALKSQALSYIYNCNMWCVRMRHIPGRWTCILTLKHKTRNKKNLPWTIGNPVEIIKELTFQHKNDQLCWCRKVEF